VENEIAITPCRAEEIFAFILAAMIMPVVATEMSCISFLYIKVKERRMRK